MKTKLLVRCPSCGRDLPESSFGVCRARKSGRNCYCRQCAYKQVREYRQRVREYKKAHGLLGKVGRKPMVLAPVDAFSKVYEVLQSGPMTRETIKEKTKLSFDLIGEALTELIFECKA